MNDFSLRARIREHRARQRRERERLRRELARLGYYARDGEEAERVARRLVRGQ